MDVDGVKILLHSKFMFRQLSLWAVPLHAIVQGLKFLSWRTTAMDEMGQTANEGQGLRRWLPLRSASCRNKHLFGPMSYVRHFCFVHSCHISTWKIQSSIWLRPFLPPSRDHPHGSPVVMAHTPNLFSVSTKDLENCFPWTNQFFGGSVSKLSLKVGYPLNPMLQNHHFPNFLM